MKFLVAPESTSAIASALFAMEWTKNQSVIDFHANKYTSPLLPCLISADLTRQLENPHLDPFPLLRYPAPGLLSSTAVLLWRPLCPSVGEWVEFEWTCCLHSR